MCRTTNYPGFQRRREALKIQALFLRFKGLNSRQPLPESITLSFLPRINGAALEVSGSKIRPESAAFVTLYRAVSEKVKKGEAVFGSREAVRVGNGTRFDIYLRDEKVLKGIFRKDEGQDWKLECKCVMEREGADITEAEVCVAVEGHVAMNERVKMVRRRGKRCGFHPLEEIPEVEDESDGGRCCVCGEMDSGDFEEGGDVEEDEEIEEELDVEGVRWTMDVGFWVICLGVGYLVSKASSKSLRRRRLF